MPSTKDDDNPFVEWLIAQLNERRWSEADLARAAGVYQSAISSLLSREKGLGVDTAKKIAVALGVSQYEVFRIAGLIDEELLDDVKATQEYIRLLAAIKDDDKRQEAIDLVETLLRRMGEKRKTDTSKRSGRTSAAKSET